MKKLLLILLTLTVCIGLFAKEMNIDRKVNSKITAVHQLGRAPQSISNAKIVKEFTLNSNQGTSRYNYDVYTGNTTGLTYNAVDLATGALTPTGAIGSAPFPMAEEYDGRISFAKVDVDQNSQIASRYGIMSIPTLIIFKDGKPVSNIVKNICPHFGPLRHDVLVLNPNMVAPS